MMILSGVLQSWQHLDEPFVYQNIHTLGYRTKHLAEHIAVLNSAAQELFRQRLDVAPKEIENQVYALLSSQRLSLNVSICVILKIYSSGEYSIENAEPSIYRGYALRGLRPEACYINQTPNVGGYASSVSLAARRMADAMAKRHNLHTAIILDSEDNVIFEPSQPLCCIINEAIILPQHNTESVELTLVEQAAKKCGLQLYHQAINRELIASADEVIVASWQGITSIGYIDNQAEYFWTIITERLIEEMQKLG